MTDHARASELLVWMVNGRIEPTDSRWLSEHLEGCASCRRELDVERRVRDAVAREPTVEFAPQASFNRLWERIEGERDMTVPGSPAAAAHQHQGVPPESAPRARAGKRAWLPLAMAAQAAVILLLCGVLWQRSTAPAFRTVTDSAPAPVATGAVIKAIFSDDVRLADVKEILASTGLVVASGPSEAGVYALAPRDARAGPVTQAAAARLRADPRVRFAELGAR
jgi:hypothetical protein